MQQTTSSTTDPLPIQEKPKPTKQGLIYSLDLGQNSGPYLLKDININNPRSVSLLMNNLELKQVAHQASKVLEGPNDSKIDLSSMNRVFDDWDKVVVRALGVKKPTIFKLTDPSKSDIEEIEEEKQPKKKEYLDLENVEEKHRSKLANIENLTAEIVFHTDTLNRLQNDLKELKITSKQLRVDLKKLKALIEGLNAETLKKELIPFMREFYAKNIKILMKEEDNEIFKLKKQLSQLEREKSSLQREVEWAEKNIRKNEKFVGVYIYRHNIKK